MTRVAKCIFNDGSQKTYKIEDRNCVAELRRKHLLTNNNYLNEHIISESIAITFKINHPDLKHIEVCQAVFY